MSAPEPDRTAAMSPAEALDDPHRYAQEAHLLRRQGIDPHPAIAALDALVAENTRQAAVIATLLRWCDEGGGAHADYIAIADIRYALDRFAAVAPPPPPPPEEEGDDA